MGPRGWAQVTLPYTLSCHVTGAGGTPAPPLIAAHQTNQVPRKESEGMLGGCPTCLEGELLGLCVRDAFCSLLNFLNTRWYICIVFTVGKHLASTKRREADRRRSCLLTKFYRLTHWAGLIPCSSRLGMLRDTVIAAPQSHWPGKPRFISYSGCQSIHCRVARGWLHVSSRWDPDSPSGHCIKWGRGRGGSEAVPLATHCSSSKDILLMTQVARTITGPHPSNRAGKYKPATCPEGGELELFGEQHSQSTPLLPGPFRI